MTDTITLVQFLPLWQSVSGIRQYSFAPDEPLVRRRTVKPGKALRKAIKNTEGLLLRPCWPTRTGLVLARRHGRTLLFHMTGRTITPGSRPIDVSDPSFRMSFAERGLYRTFTFQTDDETFVFRDFAHRLVGPQRRASSVFSDEDFSPFARLIHIFSHERLRQKFLSDLDQHKFKYAKWSRRPVRTRESLMA